MAETMTASGMAGPRRVRCSVHCWIGEGKKQIVVTGEIRGDTPHLVFCARVRKHMKTKEMSLWESQEFAKMRKRARKGVKRKSLNKKASRRGRFVQAFQNWQEYPPPMVFLSVASKEVRGGRCWRACPVRKARANRVSFCLLSPPQLC